MYKANYIYSYIYIFMDICIYISFYLYICKCLAVVQSASAAALPEKWELLNAIGPRSPQLRVIGSLAFSWGFQELRVPLGCPQNWHFNIVVNGEALIVGNSQLA